MFALAGGLPQIDVQVLHFLTATRALSMVWYCNHPHWWCTVCLGESVPGKKGDIYYGGTE